MKSAAQLILADGLSSLSMANVRKAASVSGSQLAHYFTDKQALIRAVIKGVPSFELALDVGWDGQAPTGRHAQPGHLMIAMSAVRAIPYVLAHPPGIVTAPVFGAIQLASSR